MSYESDNEYPSSEEEQEEEEEEVPVNNKKGVKPILPHTFGKNVPGQNIIGDPDENEESDDEPEDEYEEEEVAEKPKKTKSAKGKKKEKKDYSMGGESEDEFGSDIDSEVGGGDDDEEDSDDENMNEPEYDENENDSEEDEEEDADEPEKYMHHFDKEINKEYILQTHPECIPVSMEEVRAMLNVVRNADGVIIDDFHKTVPFVTKYEKARIIGQRAAQLDSGATPYTSTKNTIDSTTIAELEFEEKKIPVIIKRPLPNGAFEYWRLKDLEILY